MLEAFLLLFCLLLLPLFGVTNVPYLILFLAVVALCLPVVRLIVMRAPPYVPTDRPTLKAMMRLAGIRRGEKAYDLGCGDGRIVRAAAREGAEATGYELSGPTWLVARLLSLRTKGAEIRYGNFWNKDYSDADVVFCFLNSGPMRGFAEKIWPRLKPGTRVVSHLFLIPGAEPVAKDGDARLYVR